MGEEVHVVVRVARCGCLLPELARLGMAVGELSRTIFLSCHPDLLYLWHIHCRTVKRAVLDP